jgi:putative zinc finger/helix-turn-helix YgiT family protein
VKQPETYDVRGRRITVTVEVEVCKHCGDGIGSDEHDQKVVDSVHAEYRRQANMLTPEQIKGIRKRYKLSQKSFAALLGMSEATINRYEKGALQEQTHDNLIRTCEIDEVVRGLLQRHGHKLTAWQKQRTEQALAWLQNEITRPVVAKGQRRTAGSKTSSIIWQELLTNASKYESQITPIRETNSTSFQLGLGTHIVAVLPLSNVRQDSLYDQSGSDGYSRASEGKFTSQTFQPFGQGA